MNKLHHQLNRNIFQQESHTHRTKSNSLVNMFIQLKGPSWRDKILNPRGPNWTGDASPACLGLRPSAVAIAPSLLAIPNQDSGWMRTERGSGVHTWSAPSLGCIQSSTAGTCNHMRVMQMPTDLIFRIDVWEITLCISF